MALLFVRPSSVLRAVLKFRRKGLYWNNCDALHAKFDQYNRTLTLPPVSVKDAIERVRA